MNTKIKARIELSKSGRAFFLLDNGTECMAESNFGIFHLGEDSQGLYAICGKTGMIYRGTDCNNKNLQNFDFSLVGLKDCDVEYTIYESLVDKYVDKITLA